MNPGPYGRESPLRQRQPLMTYKDFMTIENPPKKVKNNYIVRVSTVK